ncbi:MAG: fibronectin type III domain-containing protein, partial [Candidatus Electryonea clarkiae]|nr:fibronectin type III domain-containing protein [Candidatus Electryonea clarkiae]
MLNFNLKSSLIIYLLVICGTTSGNSDLSQENLSMFNHVNKSYQTWLNERQNTGINELDESGGPDDFGYRFIDNNEQNGPEYGWVDISLTGTTIDDMDDDDFEGPIELPWDFSFYGNEYDEIYICSNGFLRFGDGSDEHGNDPIPFGGAPDNIICLFWDDLDPSGGGTIHYGTDEDDRWICQFQQISEFGGENGTITAEIILNEDGSILLQYNSLEGDIDIDGETIGIEDEEGAVGLQVSQDDEPFDYPYENLAILITLEEPDASVSGVISDSETGDPIENVLLVFGDYEAVTDDNGEYAIEQIRAGEYDVRAYVNGYYDYFDREIEFIEGENEYNFTLDPSSFPYGLVGYWTFDNQENLEEAEFGRDLRRAGTVTSITGPDQGDRAVSVGAGSFYRCFHSIPPNGHGNPEKVNQYTLVMDIRIPALNQSYSIYQTDIYNTDDSECLIDGDGHIGTTATGFSIDSLEANEWYRFVVSVDLGGVVNYYLDGQLLQIGEDQEFDGRFALSSQNDDNQVLFFADDNGEDNAIDVAMIVLFSRFLNSREIAGIGGYGHEIEGPEIIHMPVFLQSPTPTSMFVCWHYRYSIESIVRFGPTNALDSVITGTHHRFNANTIWHKVQLTDLEPNTFYYYRCVSDTAESELGRFRTLPEETDESADVRFIVYGCSSSDP